MNLTSDTGYSLIYSLFRDMIKYKINYGYQGNFTQAVSDALIAFAQSIFSVSGASMKTRRRAFYILVECIQNITRHQEIPDEGASGEDGIFLIQSAAGMYNISQGNIILDEQKAALAEKLDMVNGFDKEELNQYYKTILRGTSLSEKGGAGLGLIEIARKSGNKIDYKLNPKIFFLGVLVDDRKDRHPICLEPEDCGYNVENFNDLKSLASELEKVDEEKQAKDQPLKEAAEKQPTEEKQET